MTAHDAIEKLYLDRRFNDCINRMHPDHLRADLRQEVILVLYSKKEEDIIAMELRGELLFYAMRIVCTMIKGNRTPFMKKYQTASEEISDIVESVCFDDIDSKVELCPSVKCVLNGRVVREQKEDIAIEKIAEVFSGLYWYDQQVFLDYLRIGSFRDMEKETRIPWQSTYKTVRKTIQKIKQHVSL